MNSGPWRAPGMVCYHCNKPGHIDRFCRTRKNISDDILVTLEGKIYIETIQAEMKKTWKKKPGVLQEEPVSAPSVEIMEPTN